MKKFVESLRRASCGELVFGAGFITLSAVVLYFAIPEFVHRFSVAFR